MILTGRLAAFITPALRVAGLLALAGFTNLARADFLDGLADLYGQRHKWEGAIGLSAGYGPDYLGAEDYSLSVKPAFYLRYGRFTVSNGAGFITRRADQVQRGLGADLVRNDNLKVTLSGRLDRGRDESNSGALAGMGDIDWTLRARVSATWRPWPNWLFNAAASIDALGRGQGTVAEVSFAREVPLSPQTVFTWGGSVSMGDASYMRTWYGVTPQQSKSSGYPVYTPGAGLRDVAFSVGIRSDFAHDWVGFVNVGASQAQSEVKDSPLTFKPLGWGIGAGLAWRF